MFSRLASRIKTEWLRFSYPFARCGRGVSIHYSCEISRAAARHIILGDDVYLAPDVWLNVADFERTQPTMVLRRGCKIGRRSTISSKNYVELDENVLLAPSVLIMDHNHEYANTELPIHAQGTTAGGRITIGKNCWLGHGCVVVCGRGELTLGRNSVVAANTVVTQSFPAFSVIAGNPARVVKQYDQGAGAWLRGEFVTHAERG